MKKIIIVGASSGIGRCVAQEYISDGDWMVGIAARRIDRLEELKTLAPERIKTMAIDVTSDNAETLLLKLIAETGGMDLFLLVSGVGHQNPTLDSDVENATIATNVKGFTAMIDAAYRYFRGKRPQRTHRGSNIHCRHPWPWRSSFLQRIQTLPMVLS